ncbi:group II intron reverse transcriptase/maturase [Paenibacillus terrae]|uniref:Reverse transcriptase n=1 Tax=Paenibacillus terrae TaxID=159743 RepID=A0A0D7X1T7_9BACL|nr:group II intron reverse transcriptase/maturase [Paenibacillus terrae]KJD44007.1 reverse transcriptase [Paenibacillus terrae]
MLKRRKLRHNEYYSLQVTFDQLYSLSHQGKHVRNLIELMKDERNIRLAYRNIKHNGGRNTPGVDGLTMKDIAELQPAAVVEKIQTMFEFYTPQPVRRKTIDKANGKKRPLGIPCIWDRLFQQCILQVLEPICEAKFHNHSYGFRPNRSTHHAIARMKSLVNIGGLHHCVDIDIKGFFDNVNHGKLLKQMWTIGIRDKKLLSIISALIKAEIQGEGVPSKGTPQGGILSPLLSNIVLNELDWWISNQWETFETKHQYADLAKYRAMKKTGLKEIYIIRYADDFKILCRTRNHALRAKTAVEQFLKERLHLECSEEKSKVINLKKQWSDFLGFQLKAQRSGSKEIKHWTKKHAGYDKETGKRLFKHVVARIERSDKYVCISRMSPKAFTNAKNKIKDAIRGVQRSTNPRQAQRLNATILGIQNYYRIATQISLQLSEIHFQCRRAIFNRLNNSVGKASYTQLSKALQDRYKDYNPELKALGHVVLVPIYAQKNCPPMNLNQEICNYTEKGRRLIHRKLVLSAAQIVTSKTEYLSDRSMEYHDNRISRFISQYGRCFVTGKELSHYDWHCHHIVPYHISKDDSYNNLVVLDAEVHRLVHMTDPVKIRVSLANLSLNATGLQRLENLREKAGTGPLKEVLLTA